LSQTPLTKKLLITKQINIVICQMYKVYATLIQIK